MNYFFGQNGPGPIGGAAALGAHSHAHGHGGGLGAVDGVVSSGRDVSGPVTGLALGGRADAAYDMKSLGKHIEAVRVGSAAP